MNVIISSPGPPVTIDEVRACLIRIGGDYPSSYMDFLAKYNGGRPKPEAFRVEDHPETMFGIMLFFGVSRAVETSTLYWQQKERVEDLPEALVAIARTGTGDLICMDTKENVGRIYFYDWVGEPGKRLYDLGLSFDEFLESLFDG